MRFAIIVFVFAAVMGVFPITSFGQTPVPVAQQPTWTVGDTWTYMGPAGTPFTLTVLGVAPGQYSVESKMGSDVRTFQVNRDLSLNVFSRFQWPLEVRKQWSFNTRGQPGNSNSEVDNFTTTSTVEAYESVSVPAGTFDAFRVKGKQCNTTKNVCGDFLIWYAPRARMYVKISWAEARYWGNFSKKSTELLSFQLQ